MKKTLLLTLCISMLLMACSDGGSTQVVVQPAPQVEPQTGLDLHAVGDLVATNRATDAPTLERLINDPAINDLDLNNDGQVDYISVVEGANQYARWFKLRVDMGNGLAREIATITIKPQGAVASVQIAGDPQIYGSGYSLSFERSLNDFLLYSWLTAPHSVYYSPYHYGAYPSYYSPHVVVPVETYTARVKTITKTTTIHRDPSPSSTTSNQVKAPGSAPKSVTGSSSTQKQFDVRDTSKAIASGGFGKSQPQPQQQSQPQAQSQSSSTTSSKPATAKPTAPKSFSKKGKK